MMEKDIISRKKILITILGLKFHIDEGAKHRVNSFVNSYHEKGFEIDVIILRPEGGSYKIEKVRNIFHWLIKLGDLQQREVSMDDVNIAKLKAVDEDVKVNIYYTTRGLTNNALIFDKEIMNNWWLEGYNHAKDAQCTTYLLCKGRKPKGVKKTL